MGDGYPVMPVSSNIDTAENLEYGCESRGTCSRSAVQDKSIQVKSPTIAVELTLAPKH